MQLLNEFGKIESLYFACAKDDIIRFNASSGGFVKSFLCYLLDNNIDYTIITRSGGPETPLKPETIITNSKQDIISIRTNSVYCTNNPFQVFRFLKDDKRYAFVGLPCQVYKLRKAQSEGKYLNIVFTIELFCNYTPDRQFTIEILKKLNVKESELRQIIYRGNGWPGGFTAFLKDGTNKFIPLKDYFNRDSVPIHCQNCKLIGDLGDITVCDPWRLGLEEIEKKGLTIVICRNKYANELVITADNITLFPCAKEQLIKSQATYIKHRMSHRGTNN